MPGENYPADDRPDGVPTLRRYADALWRRKWLALAPVVVLVLATLVSTSRQESLYAASADVLVNRQEAVTTSLIGQTPVLDEASRTMDTQARLAKVPVVLERTVEAAAVDVSPSTYDKRSVVYPLGDILRFEAEGRDAAQAARLASAHAREFVRYRRELDTAGLARTLSELRAELARLEAAGSVDSPAYERLADREQQLALLGALRSSNVTVVQTATAGDAEQVSPRPKRNAALALCAGLVLGLILVFLAESLGTKPRTDEELEALLGMRLVGRLAPPGNGTSSVDEASPAADAVHALRASFELVNRAVGARTVMVASGHADEGKSVIAAQLAIALARSGRRVALVDLDLRRRSLTELFGLDERFGLPAVIDGDCTLDRALVAVGLGEGVVPAVRLDSNGRPDEARLEVVGAGAPRSHPAELASSQALGETLSELETRADVVLVDVPPLLDFPDAAALAPQLDALLLVVSSRRARGPVLAQVRRAVETWPLGTLGFVVTDGDERAVVGLLGRRSPTSAAQPERVA